VKGRSGSSTPTPSALRTKVKVGMSLYGRAAAPAPKLRTALAISIALVSALNVLVYVLVATGDEGRVGLILAAITLALAARVTWSGRAGELALLVLLCIAEAVTFVLFLMDTPAPFPYRPVLALTAILYVPVVVIGAMLGRENARAVLVGAGALTVVLLATEAGASWLVLTRAPGIALDRAAPGFVLGYGDVEEVDPEIGPVPVPFSVTESRYPDNPRGYFHVRESSWSLSRSDGSTAILSSSGDEVTVSIERADDPPPWSIQLSRQGFVLEEGTEYLMRFRARAGAPRTFSFSVSMAHDPWESMGLFEYAFLDTVWTSFERAFTATRSDESVRVQMDLGGDTTDVQVSDVVLARRVNGAPAVSGTGFVSYEWNSRGCRASEYPIPASPGSFRILALGDSYTAGVGVHGEDVFASVLERLLRERAAQMGDSTSYEFIGCGVSGFGTREERLYYEERARAYRPDLVLVVLVADDDRSFVEDERLGFVHTPAKWEYLFQAGYLVQSKRHARPEPDFTDAMDELATITGIAQGDGASLGIVVFRNGEDPAWQDLLSSAYTFAQDVDVPMVDLGPQLLADQLGSLDLFVRPSDRHPNEIAHRIAAERILDWIVEEGLIEPRR
jgi:hypothetical protein